MTTAPFVDTNIFIYAYIKPRRKLKPHEVSIKDSAKKTLSRINEGENVSTTVVHFSELCNILEDNRPLREASTIEEAILFKENITIHPVNHEDYLKALHVAREKDTGINDAIAYTTMEKLGVNKIYSFDKDFDKFNDIKRITS